ncbi:hypothetical protein JCM11641_004604 [Rhodosporidiobolus odoratus]
MSTASTRPASPSSTPSSDTTSSANPPQAPLSAADVKRAQRAAKKAEQDARKEERKRIMEETGVDPALLPGGREQYAKGGKETRGFLPREWVDVGRKDGEEQGEAGGHGEGRKVKLFSWNMLAQALVRREVFPGSDYLKGKDRLPPLMAQVSYYAPDIACLQEVDRLSTHLPSLTLTHGYTSFVGYPNKAHGLVIAHKSSMFNKVGEKGIRLDHLAVSSTSSPRPTANGTTPPPSTDEDSATQPDARDGDDARPPDAPSVDAKASRKQAGITRSTRNVGLFVALEFKDQPGKGVIVGTTHLFWAGEYVYERTRQTGILFREGRKFRDESEGGRWKDWPLLFAGDFNTQPYELAYRLAVSPSSTIPDALLADFERSRVVHHSVDKLHNPDFEPPTPAQAEAKEGEESADTKDGDGDASDNPTLPRTKPIKNSRPPNEDGSDGIATLDELRELFSSSFSSSASTTSEGAQSAYGDAYGLCDGQQGRWYCDRPPGVQAGNGWKVEEKREEWEKRQEGEWEERIKRGDFEPRFSNFTPLWRCTLDYIFLIAPSSPDAPRRPEWRSLLQMHDFHQTCEPGLPRKGIEPSDHVAIGAVIEVF